MKSIKVAAFILLAACGTAVAKEHPTDVRLVLMTKADTTVSTEATIQTSYRSAGNKFLRRLGLKEMEFQQITSPDELLDWRK